MISKRDKITVSPARRAAFDALRRVEAEGAFASILIASLAQSGLSREDHALAQEIILGTLRWQKTLDYFIERYSHRSIERIDPPVRVALRIGLYQLRHLTRIPRSAAVNESVNLVKLARMRSAAAMVNAALRNAARSLDDRAGQEILDPLERASIELSHPAWMLKRWQNQLGESESRALAFANNEPPRAAFRVNTLRASEDETLASLRSQGVRFRASEWVPGALVVERGEAAREQAKRGGDAPEADQSATTRRAASAVAQAADDGLIYLQDEASQLVSLLLGAKSGERILDLCAAPGSKTSHIAALTRNESWVMACDIHPHRLATLAATCHRLGAQSVDAVALDARRELPITARAPKFDRVLIDAPCSGTGTLRRNPEIKWRLAPGDITQLADAQFSLLTQAVDAVATGGRLVYSTCSIEPEENEAVIERFFQSGALVRLVEPDAHPSLVTAGGFVRTFPHRHGTDGFFAAVLEKIER